MGMKVEEIENDESCWFLLWRVNVDVNPYSVLTLPASFLRVHISLFTVCKIIKYLVL